MSNALAISAVTAALRRRLDASLIDEVPGARVTTCPPDRARDLEGPRVNLFLYQVVPSPARRNTSLAGGLPAVQAASPLALNLYYLFSAYGQEKNETDLMGHQLLGKVMAYFHTNPILEASELLDATTGGDGLVDQIDRVQIIPQPLDLDQLTRLWTAFGTPYRISVAYEVSVVLV
jgi:hypothetical protein